MESLAFFGANQCLRQNFFPSDRLSGWTLSDSFFTSRKVGVCSTCPVFLDNFLLQKGWHIGVCILSSPLCPWQTFLIILGTPLNLLYLVKFQASTTNPRKSAFHSFFYSNTPSYWVSKPIFCTGRMLSALSQLICWMQDSFQKSHFLL